ncbi:MAG: SWIM zinc finger family protein [Caldilineaceae bacterium]|nr:SWIM zinc finger family protein [Caldilineaceae bacterium]
MSRYERYNSSRAIDTDKGIKARSKRGDFAENWWAQRWIKALERITDAGRLRRGRSYARKGQVLSLTEERSAIHAKVQGSRSRPYSVTIQLQPLSDSEWDGVMQALSEQALFTAQLLAGEMPHEIEEVFQAAGASLFPDKKSELITECSCPDWANPCKHVAATHYILGEQFDIDPFLLFRLRGRDQAAIVHALRSMRAADQAETADHALAEAGVDYATENYAADNYAAESDTPLDQSVDDFWRMGESLDHFPTYLHEPTTPMSILRRLGKPAFLSDNAPTAFRPIYERISQEGLDIAYTGGSDRNDAIEPDDELELSDDLDPSQDEH